MTPFKMCPDTAVNDVTMENTSGMLF